MTDTTGGAMFYTRLGQNWRHLRPHRPRARTQYRLAYYPVPAAPPTPTALSSSTSPQHLQVRHRKSYLTGPQ